MLRVNSPEGTLAHTYSSNVSRICLKNSMFIILIKFRILFRIIPKIIFYPGPSVNNVVLEDLPPYTWNPTSGSFGRPGRIVPVMESPIGLQVQMLQEGVCYLQTACEMFARLERTLGEIMEEFGRW